MHNLQLESGICQLGRHHLKTQSNFEISRTDSTPKKVLTIKKFKLVAIYKFKISKTQVGEDYALIFQLAVRHPHYTRATNMNNFAMIHEK